MASVYEIVTDRIISQLEQGVIPWRKPWVNGEPMNLVSKKAYRGINAIVLAMSDFASPFWVTFNQAKDLGGSVRKGEKGTPVMFWKFPKRADVEAAKAKGEKVPAPIVRYYTVFNVTQCEGLDVPAAAVRTNNERIAAAEAVVASMPNRPALVTDANAWFNPMTDTVGMPPLASFENAERYYSTLFHELVHSTGHASRIGREGVVKATSFGSEPYAQEELVAEIGAAMLSAVAGIETATVDQSAAYVAGWLKALKNDRRMVVFGASQAQRAADFIRGLAVSDEISPASEGDATNDTPRELARVA